MAPNTPTDNTSLGSLDDLQLNPAASIFADAPVDPAEIAEETPSLPDPETLWLIRAVDPPDFQRSGVRFDHSQWLVVENPTEAQLNEVRLVCVKATDPNFDRRIGPLPIKNPELLPARSETPTVESLLQQLSERDGQIASLKQIAEGESEAHTDAANKLAEALRRNQELDQVGQDKDKKIAALELDNQKLHESLSAANEATEEANATNSLLTAQVAKLEAELQAATAVRDVNATVEADSARNEGDTAPAASPRTPRR